MDDVAENLASDGSQEVPVAVTQLEDVDDRKQEITDEDIEQESQSDLGVESLSKAANCEVEDDGDEGEDGRYQEGGWVEDTRQIYLVHFLWSFLIQWAIWPKEQSVACLCWDLRTLLSWNTPELNYLSHCLILDNITCTNRPEPGLPCYEAQIPTKNQILPFF